MGHNWHEEVGSVSNSAEIKQKSREYYRGRAEREIKKLRAGVPNPDSVLADPKKYRFESAEDLDRYKPFKVDVPKDADSKDTKYHLSTMLMDYFRENLQGKTDNPDLRANQETFITLYYLSNKKSVYVDLILKGETVEIQNGVLSVYHIDPETDEKKVRVRDVSLKPIKAPRGKSDSGTPKEEGPVSRFPERTRPTGEVGPATSFPERVSTPKKPKSSEDLADVDFDEEPITPLPPLDTLRVRTANIMEYTTSLDLISEGRTEHNILPEVRKLRELLGVFLESRTPTERKNLLEDISSKTTDLRANVGLIKGEADTLLAFLKRTKREKAEELSPVDRDYLDKRISDLTRLTQALNYFHDALVHMAPRLITLEQQVGKNNYQISLTPLATFEDVLGRVEKFLVRLSESEEGSILIPAGADIPEEMSADEKRTVYKQLMATSAYALGYSRDEENVGLDKLRERLGGEDKETEPYKMVGYRGIKTLLQNARTSTSAPEKSNLLNTAFDRLMVLHENAFDALHSLQRQTELVDKETLYGLGMMPTHGGTEALPEAERLKLPARARILEQAIKYCEKLLSDLSGLAREILHPDLNPYLNADQRTRLKKEFGY